MVIDFTKKHPVFGIKQGVFWGICRKIYVFCRHIHNHLPPPQYMRPLHKYNVNAEEVKRLLAQQIIVSVATMGTKIVWLKAYFFEPTEQSGEYALRYEVVSLNTILLSTMNVDEAVSKYQTLVVEMMRNEVEPEPEAYQPQPSF
jgi:hypothetical protein